MDTQTNTTQQTMPTLSNPLASTAFAAFKAEERFSFVRSYNSKEAGIEGYRHAVIRYRATGKNSVERPAKMVTIPQVGLSEAYVMPADAAKVLIGILEDEQDSIIRSLIDAGASTIVWDCVSLAATLASITAVRTSNRLTKEQVEAWAVSAFADVCNQRADEISKTKGYDVEQAKKQRAGTLNAYVALATKMAAPVPNIGSEGAMALKALINRANLADDIAKTVLAKIEAILNPKVLEAGDL